MATAYVTKLRRMTAAVVVAGVLAMPATLGATWCPFGLFSNTPHGTGASWAITMFDIARNVKNAVIRQSAEFCL